MIKTAVNFDTVERERERERERESYTLVNKKINNINMYNQTGVLTYMNI